MKILATVQCKNEAQAINTGRNTPIEQLFSEKLPVGTYVYVNTDGEIVAASVPTDATPQDEVMWLGNIGR